LRKNFGLTLLIFAVFGSCTENDVAPAPTVDNIYPLTDVAGTNVTVNGKGFRTTTEVKFNGIESRAIARVKVLLPSGSIVKSLH
jgi:hypothetical protein